MGQARGLVFVAKVHTVKKAKIAYFSLNIYLVEYISNSCLLPTGYPTGFIRQKDNFFRPKQIEFLGGHILLSP